MMPPSRPLGPELVHRGRGDEVLDLDQGHFTDARDEVVEESSTAQPAVRAVRDLFHERAPTPEPPADDLAFDDHRVDQDAAVLGDHVAQDCTAPVAVSTSTMQAWVA